MTAARPVPDWWTGAVTDHIFVGGRVVVDASFGTARTRLGLLAGAGMLQRACEAAYSEGIVGLAAAAGPPAGRPGGNR